MLGGKGPCSHGRLNHLGASKAPNVDSLINYFIRNRQEEIKKFEASEEKEERLIQSIGKSTAFDEAPTPSKKRFLSEFEEKPVGDRFMENMLALHNDEFKDPMTFKRAPLNAAIIEELDRMRKLEPEEATLSEIVKEHAILDK